jgi:transposase-like protein
MKAIRYMDEELVIRKGIDLLMNGLGPLETIRFINISREAKLDSVKRHRSWQRQLDKKSFFDAVFSENE